jgi:DNA polymerase III epsilon subunit family exonuclease
MLDADFAVVDLETTGFAADGPDRIVELAILRCRPNAGVVDRFVTLVDPGRRVGATAVHGLRPGDLIGAPPFAAIARDVARRLQGAVIVAHNSRFDVAFLQAELARAGRPALRGPTLCTIALAARLRVPVAGRSLRACCTTFDVPYDEAAVHGAERDARATARLLLCLLREAREQRIASLEELGCASADDGGAVAAAPSSAPAPPPARGRPAPAHVALAARRLGDMSLVGDADVAAYLDLVDRVLADRVLTAAETDALRAFARRARLSDAVVARAHAEYVEGLEELAWADGELTADEAADLGTVAVLLGVTREAVWRS